MMDYDLTRGYQKYDSAVKNLEGILDKVKVIFDITNYQSLLNEIKTKVENDEDLSKKMPYAGMQSDLEAFVFDDYVKKIEEITKKIEEELKPFYETYLLYTKINLNIAKISDENIIDIIDTTRMLVDSLNLLTNNLTDEQKVIVDEAYKTIYNVILYEEIFERNDILNYVNSLNTIAFKENLGRLLGNDLNKLSEEVIINENLNNIGTEGLGFDYFNEDIIKQVSSKTVGEANSSYLRRKNEAIDKITTKVNNAIEKKDKLTTKYLENKYGDNIDYSKIVVGVAPYTRGWKEVKKDTGRDSKNPGLYADATGENGVTYAYSDIDSLVSKYNLKLNKNLLTLKALSVVLVPVITITAGYRIGKSKSNKIDEYKTITRTINLETGSLIGNQVEEFDEHSTTYVATVLKCGPWHSNNIGNGYIRNVTAYDYITPETANETDDFHITKDNLDGNLIEKYQYIEAKDTLDSNENTTDTTIIITETYQDKTINRKSTKFIIPFTLLGIGLGALISFILAYTKIYDIETIQNALYNLDKKIKERITSNEDIKKELEKLQEYATELQKELQDVERKYGKINVNKNALKINLKKY